MSTSFVLTAILAMLTPDTQTEPEKQFEAIATAVNSADTCEQLGFTVDRSGLADWGESAREQTVAAGWTYEDATDALFAAVERERQRVLQRHARVLLMRHSIESTDRNKSNWNKRCEKLASLQLSGAYFSKP
jgi:hypothetical protein